METDYYEFSGAYENRDVLIVTKQGITETGYVEAVFPADEDDSNRLSFYLNLDAGKGKVFYVDDIKEISVIDK